MTRKSVGFLCAAAICAATLSVSISSCDSNNNPATPGGSGQNNSGKTPQVLDGPCLGTVAVTDCPVGGASVRYVDGDLAVSGLNRYGVDGVTCEFSRPINVWKALVRAQFPGNGTGALGYVAQDDQGNIEAKLDIAENTTQGYAIRPTFTSPPDGGTPSYNAQIFRNGLVVGSLNNIDVNTSIQALPECTVNIFRDLTISWEVYTFNAQCIWKLQLPPGCCTLKFILPDGTVISGDALRLQEQNSRGLYPYRLTRRITTTGTLPSTATAASYAVKAASAILTN